MNVDHVSVFRFYGAAYFSQFIELHILGQGACEQQQLVPCIFKETVELRAVFSVEAQEGIILYPLSGLKVVPVIVVSLDRIGLIPPFYDNRTLPVVYLYLG